jgi:hypothetical protein
MNYLNFVVNPCKPSTSNTVYGFKCLSASWAICTCIKASLKSMKQDGVNESDDEIRGKEYIISSITGYYS